MVETRNGEGVNTKGREEEEKNPRVNKETKTSRPWRHTSCRILNIRKTTTTRPPAVTFLFLRKPRCQVLLRHTHETVLRSACRS